MTDRPKTRSTGANRGLGLIALLAAVTAVGPFSLQALAPALPAVARSFEVSAASSQTLLSVSLAAMALATLVWGPLSDRFGRRPMMVAGMALAALGSVMTALSPTLTIALFGRVLQAAGAVAGMVLARAVAQDLFGRDGAAGAIGKITAGMVVAPMIAPALSGLVVEEIGWRGIFVIVAVAAAFLALVCRARLPETARVGTGQGFGDTLRGFRQIARLPDFWRHAVFSSCSLASFLFFVGVAPYVMQETFGLGPVVYGAYFMLLAGAYLVSNLACGRLSRRFGSARTLVFGAVICVAGPALAFVLLALGPSHPAAMFVPAMLHSLGAGLAVPNAMAGAVGAAPERAGAASGLLGFCQFLFAGLVTQLGGFLPHDTALPAVGGMAILGGLGLLGYLAIGRGRTARGGGLLVEETEPDPGRAA